MPRSWKDPDEVIAEKNAEIQRLSNLWQIEHDHAVSLAAEVARLRDALGAWKTAFWTADQFSVAIHDADGKFYSVRAQDYHRMDELFHDRADHAARREGEA